MSLFIVLEGIEGAGKSTLQTRLAEFCREKGHEAVLTREPGATELGKSIRTLLLSRDGTPIDSTTELFLFAADRAEHVAQVIRPALEKKAVVICDRYLFSTIAYQGFARGLAREKIDALNEIATSGLRPDLVLLLDLEPEVGLKRARSRGDSNWSRFEEEELDFHRKVRAGFLELSKDPNNRFVVLDAKKSEDELAKDALIEVEKLLGQ